MTVDRIVQDRFMPCISRSSNRNANVALRENKAMMYILKLQNNHPLRVSLAKVRPASQ